MSNREQDLSGKTYLVTGANSGIGLEAANNCASRGAITLIVSRDQGRGDAARQEMIQASGNAQV